MRGQRRWYHGKIRGCGYRLTLPRQKILQVLSATSEHLSAEDIYHKVHTIYPAVGLTTIYRTLDLLVNAGLVFKFDFGDGKTRYELTKGPADSFFHYHLICTNCRRVVDCCELADKEKETMDDIRQKFSKKYKFDLRSHQINFYGLCDRCRKDLSK